MFSPSNICRLVPVWHTYITDTANSPLAPALGSVSLDSADTSEDAFHTQTEVALWKRKT